MPTSESKLGCLVAWALVLGGGSAACGDPSDHTSTSQIAHRGPADAGGEHTAQSADDAERDAGCPDDSGLGSSACAQPLPDVVCYANQQRYSPGETYVQEGCVPAVCACQDNGAFECIEQSFTCNASNVELQPNEVFEPDECTRCYCCADGLSCSPLGCEADCEVGVIDADARRFEETWDAAGCLSCECRSFGRVFCSRLPECEGSCVHQGLPHAEGDVIEVAGFEAGCSSICRCNAAGSFECGQAGSCAPSASCPGQSAVDPVNAFSEENCECQPDGYYLCAN